MGAANLYNWMLKTFPLDQSNTIQVDGANAGINGSNLPQQLGNNHGIYIMIPNNPNGSGFNATGHACIYTNPSLSDYYFNASGGIKFATLWILN